MTKRIQVVAEFDPAHSDLFGFGVDAHYPSLELSSDSSEGEREEEGQRDSVASRTIVAAPSDEYAGLRTIDAGPSDECTTGLNSETNGSCGCSTCLSDHGAFAGGDNVNKGSSSNNKVALGVDTRTTHELLSKIADLQMPRNFRHQEEGTRELLLKAAQGSNIIEDFDLLEARSCLSSPGRTNFTLRERLHHLSRDQRKKLLLSGRGSRTGGVLVDRSDPPAAYNAHFNETNHNNADAAILDEDQGYEDQDYFYDVNKTLTRLRRHTTYGNKGPVVVQNNTKAAAQPPSEPHFNNVKLHIYDLISKDALMQLPWGCIIEIGQCFSDVNGALHSLGTGAYHVGVEVNGLEFAYGAASTPGKTGIFSCIPKYSPGYSYRTSIDFGNLPVAVRKAWREFPCPENPLSTSYQEVEENLDGLTVIRGMVPDYMGTDYDILRKNCCTFAHDACVRLGVQESDIPSWFRNLADSGALTHDVALATVHPFRMVMSTCETVCDDKMEFDPDDDILENLGDSTGFEVIRKRNATDTRDVDLVVDTKSDFFLPEYHMRRTATWTY